ncbi:MAG: hypothetical protein NT169_07650 [Chloroflexi bacterium]|nr:hypothetical protein [Chloroflexota bacterium]
MESPSQTPYIVRAAQAVFFLNAAIWLQFGVLSLIRMAGGSPDRAITAGIVAILMFGNVAAMLLCGVGLGKQQKRFYYLAVAVLVVNILLTVTDQFGVLDFITLVIDVGLLALLIATRSRYLSAR